MKRILFVATMLIAASFIALGQNDPRLQNRTMTKDEEALKQIVKEWADAAVHADLAKLEKIADDNFNGSSEGLSFKKKMLLAAVRSGQMKVAAWTIDNVKVSIRGNSATVTGRSMLSNAIYMGQDFSGEYEWTDRFVKQKDGSWRAVSSQSKRIKK
jgi:ketosteroid isomerase-like protein